MLSLVLLIFINAVPTELPQCDPDEHLLIQHGWVGCESDFPVNDKRPILWQA